MSLTAVNRKRQTGMCCTLLILACCTTIAATWGDAQPAKPPPPNVVIVLADDLGYGDIGVYGATRIKTPHIDALAKRGLRFRHAYASANVCSPSRAGLLTGRYAIRSGLAWKVVSSGAQHGLPSSEETIAELASRAGYRTMLVGKWHLGGLPKFSPLKHGFDEFFGVPHSNDMPDFHLFRGNRRIEASVDQRMLTRRYTEASVDFIRRNSDRPFLLLLSHTFPHIPLFASPGFEGRSEAGLYGDTVEEIDWSTGELVRTLRELGLLENTLILFTSDNGPFFEGSAGSMRGGKGNTWEGGYRVPFIASWPAGIRAKQKTDYATMNTDVLPTIAEVTATQPAATTLDGVSLIPVFNEPGIERAGDLLYFNNETVVGIRRKSWKLVTHAYYTTSLGAFERFDALPGFKAPYPLLFDVGQADGEAYSYAERHPDVTAQMTAALQAARAVFAPLRTHAPHAEFPPPDRTANPPPGQ